uniref:BZIP domain-containing protein n=1 Tax=Panagrolaimus sp. JU765 TaxID=591449 RepID=A0AC34QNV0_9BILA
MSAFIPVVAQNAFIKASVGTDLEYLFGECVAADFDAGAASAVSEAANIQYSSTLAASNEWKKIAQSLCLARTSDAFVRAQNQIAPRLLKSRNVALNDLNRTSLILRPDSPQPLPPPGDALCRPPFCIPPSCSPFMVPVAPISDEVNLHSIFFDHNRHSNSSDHICQSSSSSSSPDYCNTLFSSSPNPIDGFDFLDSLICQVREEIEAEKALFTPSVELFVPRKSSLASSYQPSPPLLSSASCSSSSSSPIPSDCSSFDSQPRERAKKYSLANLSLQELNERKKQQNKIAARRYRSRKMEQFRTNKDEIARLEARNAELRHLEASLGQQIAVLKNLMIQQISKA